MKTEPNFLASPEALADFLAAFERPCLPKGEWTHAAHVAMAAVFLRRYDTQVLGPTRTAIQRFNASVGGPPTAYHETLTILWLAIVAEALTASPQPTDLAAARLAVKHLGADSKRHEIYYSYDVIRSEARTTWSAPDMRPLHIPFATS